MKDKEIEQFLKDCKELIDSIRKNKKSKPKKSTKTKPVKR